MLCTGELLATVLKAHPQLRGVLLDLPHVVAEAEPVLAARGVRERCRVVGGDFFVDVPAGGDVLLLKQVLHDWDDAQATRLLLQCQRALPSGGTLLAVEMVLPADNTPSPVQAMDLNMLVMLGGRERTANEYATLFAAAGFELKSVTQTHSPFCVIEAVRR